MDNTYVHERKSLDVKGIEDIRVLFVSATLANIALNSQVSIDNFHSLIYGLGAEEVDFVDRELRKIIEISKQTTNSIDSLDMELCSISDLNHYIWENCNELCPELLSLYLIMNAFTEVKSDNFDHRVIELTKVKTGEAGKYIHKFLNPNTDMEELDAKMWNTSKEIINLIKGNKNV